MDNIDIISLVTKMQTIVQLSDEKLSNAANIPVWILESIKCGKLRNDVTIAGVLSAMVNMSNKQRGCSTHKLAKLVNCSDDDVWDIEKAKSRKWDLYLKSVERLSVDGNLSDEKILPDKDFFVPDDNAVQIYLANGIEGYGNLANDLLHYSIQHTNAKVATNLTKKGFNSEIIKNVTTGRHPEIRHYHTIIRYCLRLLANEAGLQYKTWKLKDYSYVKFDAMTKDLPGNESGLLEYALFFQYIAFEIGEKENKTLQKEKEHQKTKTIKNNQHKHKSVQKKKNISKSVKTHVSPEGSAVRRRSYTVGGDFDYGLTDT